MLKKADCTLCLQAHRHLAEAQVPARQEFVSSASPTAPTRRSEVGGCCSAITRTASCATAGSVGTGWASAHWARAAPCCPGWRRNAVHRSGGVEAGPMVKARAGTSAGSSPRWSSRWRSGNGRPTAMCAIPKFAACATDKPAEAIGASRQRQAAPRPAPARRCGPRRPSRSLNPDRVIDPSTGLRKVDLVHYYESVAECMLPHSEGPGRCRWCARRQGITGELFFQKHPGDKVMPGMKDARSGLWPGHDGAAGRRQRRVADQCRADERRRVPYLELQSPSASTSPTASSSTWTRAKA
jgi:bifunctional non-homologous end joining protein LigD